MSDTVQKNVSVSEETPAEKITVKGRCATADINLATFYTHYDTLMALLEEIDAEKSRERFDTLSTLWGGKTSFPTYWTAF